MSGIYVSYPNNNLYTIAKFTWTLVTYRDKLHAFVLVVTQVRRIGQFAVRRQRRVQIVRAAFFVTACATSSRSCVGCTCGLWIRDSEKTMQIRSICLQINSRLKMHAHSPTQLPLKYQATALSIFLGIICAHSGVPVTPGGRHLGAFAATNMQTPVGWISESSRINGITKSSLLRKSEESAWHRPGEVMLG